MLARAEMLVVFVHNEQISYGSLMVDDGWRPKCLAHGQKLAKCHRNKASGNR